MDHCPMIWLSGKIAETGKKSCGTLVSAIQGSIPQMRKLTSL